MNARKDPRVDAYIAASAPFARPILTHLRTLAHQACPQIEETLKWSFPHFVHHGIVCSMASFSKHCALGFWHQGVSKAAAKGSVKSNDAMGQCGRITCREDLPPDSVLLGWIREAVRLNEAGVPARPTRKPKAPLPLPADLAALLKQHPVAKVAWDRLPPGQRREYLEWIAEAKREETRQKRLATTVEWVGEGKSLHWKYKDC